MSETEVLSIIQRIFRLEEHHNRQIDENRAASKRMDELERMLIVNRDSIGCVDGVYNESIVNLEEEITLHMNRLMILEDFVSQNYVEFEKWTKTAVGDLSERQTMFESKCREFEKQRFYPVRNAVDLICKKTNIKEGRIICPNCRESW